MKVFQYQVSTSGKRSKQQFTSKTIFSTFCNLIALIIDWNCVKGLRVTKIVKQIKFKAVWGKLGRKVCFQRQSLRKYLRQTLVFMRNSALRESPISIFHEFLASIESIFILAERLGLVYNSSKFWYFPDFSLILKIRSFKSFGNSWGTSYTPCLLLIIMFLFTCGERKIWQNIKKSHNIISMIDFLKNFPIFFMSLLTAPVVESSHIYTRIDFIFSKSVLKQTWQSFNTKFQHQQKDRNSSYQVWPFLAFFTT